MIRFPTAIPSEPTDRYTERKPGVGFFIEPTDYF